MMKRVAVFSSELEQFDDALCYLFEQVEYDEVTDYITQKKIVKLVANLSKSASSEDLEDESYMEFITEIRALMNFVIDNGIDVILGN